jgi:hypothetical protein
METLLKPGDMIRIREDIQQCTTYKMINDSDIGNTWIEEDMLPAGTLVEIVNISKGQYIVKRLDESEEKDEYFDDDFWLYTDQMFDPEMLIMLMEKDYFNL